VSHTTVQDDLNGGKKLPSEPTEPSNDAGPTEADGKKLPPPTTQLTGEEAAQAKKAGTRRRAPGARAW
jgi:hypothetical protein